MKVRDFLCLMALLTISSSRLTTLSLDQVASYNTEGMTCEQFWADQKIHQNLLQWQKAYNMHESGQLQADLDVLYELRSVVKEGMEGDISFLEQGDELKKKLKDILKRISDDPNQLGSAQKAKIRQHVQEIIQSDGEETPSCCALLFGLVEYLMSQMENMQNQCQKSAPPTRIKISGKIDRIEILRAECGPPPPECQPQKEKVKKPKEPVEEEQPPIPPRRRRNNVPPPQSNYEEIVPEQPEEKQHAEEVPEESESVSESYDSTSEEEEYEEEPPKVAQTPPPEPEVIPPPEKKKVTPSPPEPEPVVTQPTLEPEVTPPPTPEPEVKPPPTEIKEKPEQKKESPPPLQPAPQIPQGLSPICVQGNRKILEASHQGDPLADVQIHQEDLNDVSEYSVAMWLRFLTRGGQPMYRGMIDPWYFVFRLANKKQYGNVQLGDRILAAFIGPQAYQFSTYDMRARNPSVNQFLKNEAIEAQWSYVYFGYSRTKKIARVWFQNDGDTPQAIQFRDIWHDQPNFLRLVIGGTDLGLFPGFNGQITSPVLRVGNGAYLETIQDIELYGLQCNPQPKELCGRLSVNQVVQDYVTREFSDPASKQFELNTDYSTEYAIAGWFKWQTPSKEQTTNSIFRVTINNPDVNSNSVFLGDRALFAQWSRNQVQLYTYSYHDMRGVGNPSIRQPLEITNTSEWFFIYMAYSRDLRQAYAFSMQNKQKNEVTFYKVNHYVANRHFVQVGSDKFFPGFNGQLTYVDYLFCRGAYNPNYKSDLIPFVPQPAPQPPKVEPPKVETPKVEEPIAPEPPTEELAPPPKEEEPTPPSKFPEPPTEEEPPVPIKCVEGSNRTLTAGSKTVVDSEIPVVKDPSEYGFGFWFRFLTRYPRILQNGLAQDTYFMARVTSIKDYNDQNIGDRLLLVTQEAGSFRFYSDDQRADRPAKKSLSYQDIEGQWMYIYFSHHVKLQKSTGFLFHDGLEKVEMTVIQPTVEYIRLVIGGADLNKYQAFNGQVSRPVLKLGRGAYIANEDQIAGYAIVCNPQPVWTCDGQSQDIIEEGVVVDASTDREPFDVLVRLPEEYSVVGWFKWNQDTPNDQALFRLTINKDRMTDAKTLGDRVLNAIVSDDDGGSLFLSTYSYTSLTGDGDPTVTKRLQVDETLQKWFFMYFGYSRVERAAFAKLNVGDAVLKMKFDSVNHYLSPIFRFYVGNDPFRRTFPGQLSGVKVFFCEGAYTTVFPPVPPPPVPESQIDPTPIIQEIPVPEIKKTCVKGADITLESSEVSQSVINATVTKAQLKDSSEYGYGYWLKFMTRYPSPLVNGLEDHQYFISRLSKNDPYKNLGFGDRMLALWQTQDKDGFLFVTNDLVSGSANVYKQVENDGDIEGVWQYIYFSYSRAKRQAVGMIQRQGGRTRMVEFDVTHPVPLLFKFILGGSDLDIYPGFNGIFAKPVLRIGSGSFLANEDELLQFSQACNHVPVMTCPLKLDFSLIDEPKSFVEGQTVKAISLTSEDGFPQEYSVAGWFRWNGAEIFPWHLLFRLTINNESINKNNKLLGDRVLAAWMGGNQGGSAAIATYTYTDLKGSGNPNILDINKLGLQNLIKWNHYYAGYSASEAKVYASVWNGGDSKVEFKLNDIHHYEAKTFFMYVAGDQFYRAFAGQIAKLNAHLCLGAYTMDYPHGDIPQLPVIPAEVPKPVNPIQPPQQTQDDCITIPHKEINLRNVDDVIKYLQETKNQLLGNQSPAQEVCYCTYFAKEQPSLLQIASSDPWLKVVI